MEYSGKSFAVFSKGFSIAATHINPVFWCHFYKLQLVAGNGRERAQKSPPQSQTCTCYWILAGHIFIDCCYGSYCRLGSATTFAFAALALVFGFVTAALAFTTLALGMLACQVVTG